MATEPTRESRFGSLEIDLISSRFFDECYSYSKQNVTLHVLTSSLVDLLEVEKSTMIKDAMNTTI